MLVTAFVFSSLAEGAISIYGHWNARYGLLLHCVEICTMHRDTVSHYISLASLHIPSTIFEGTFSSNAGDSLERILRDIADNTPLKTAATWLNWIIVRCVLY